MLRFQLTRPQQLTPEQIGLWDHLQRAHRSFESPYFRPGFTQAVAAVRDDVELVVIEEDGQAAGFFPFQRSSLNLGKPVGGRLNDFHGVILPAGFRVDARQLIGATRLATWDFDHFLGDQPSFAAFTNSTEQAAYIELADGFNAWCQERKQAGTEVVRKTESRQRKFEREVGTLYWEFETQQPERVLDQLIAWKVAQFERTGFMNLFAFPWTKQLLQNLLTGRPELSGVLSVVWHGDEPVAISYALRSFDVLHAWFIAYNQTYSTYSPGMVLMLHMIEQAAASGVRRIHLGAGDQRFKQSLASGSITVGIGTIEVPTPSTVLRDAWRWTRSTAAAARWLRYCKDPVKLLLKPVRSWLAFR